MLSPCHLHKRVQMQVPLDKPLSELEFRQGGKNIFEQIVKLSQDECLTLAEIGKRYGQIRLVL